jgi:hypothetical protein
MLHATMRQNACQRNGVIFFFFTTIEKSQKYGYRKNCAKYGSSRNNAECSPFFDFYLFAAAHFERRFIYQRLIHMQYLPTDDTTSNFLSLFGVLIYFT